MDSLGKPSAPLTPSEVDDYVEADPLGLSGASIMSHCQAALPVGITGRNRLGTLKFVLFKQ